MIFSDRKLIFIHVPKTGGNFFSRAFVEQSDDELVLGQGHDGKDRFQVRGAITEHKHQDLSDYYRQLQGALAEYTVIAIARPPAPRLVSLYYSPHQYVDTRHDPVHGRSEPRFSALKFIKMAWANKSLVEYLDFANLESGLSLSEPARHKSGARIRLLDFRNLVENLTLLAEEFGLDKSAMPEAKVNKGLGKPDRRSELCAHPAVTSTIRLSRHRKDLRIFE